MELVMYKYYLFISYSRHDSRAAAYLQRQLEHFRIPVKLVSQENLPEGGKYLRPVFRDRRDLKNTEKSFTADIKVALEQSRFLLVLCSPNSADSKWVGEEIRHFLETHDGDCAKVVPVILSGRPGSGGAEECLPPPLRTEQVMSRNLPSMIPDDGEGEKAGWENGVVQSLSYMLIEQNIQKIFKLNNIKIISYHSNDINKKTGEPRGQLGSPAETLRVA